MRKTFALVLFLAATAAAAPVITSITPSTGKVAGGETVTIKGAGFTSGTVVFFGISTQALNIRVVDASTITAVTPPLLPMTFDVSVVRGQDDYATLPQAYTVTGDPSEAFETILFPIYPWARGAFGSYWVTSVVATAKTDLPVNVYGATDIATCGALNTPGLLNEFITVLPNYVSEFRACTADPARLMYVVKTQANDVTFNARVAEMTRKTSSPYGTEIPIVRSSRMTNGRIVLLNVPIDDRYRLTLRIYALRPTVALVTTVGEPLAVPLQPGGSIFEPAYAQFNDFPVPIDPGAYSYIKVVIDQPQDIIAGPLMWAFITVTNNETQQMTTITPD